MVLTSQTREEEKDLLCNHNKIKQNCWNMHLTIRFLILNFDLFPTTVEEYFFIYYISISKYRIGE